MAYLKNNSMKLNIVVAPYRDAYFYHNYGPAVRDLQFIFELEKLEQVSKITIINRPVSILEKILLKKPIKKLITTGKISTVHNVSKDIFGAIKGRAWAQDIYSSAIEKTLKENYNQNKINVFLDFLPIGTFEANCLNGWYYWYDLIDNFKKHNRFSVNEKKLVDRKYQFASKYSDLITGVTEASLASFNIQAKQVISNKVFIDSTQTDTDFTTSNDKYDFGFIGFVTDKFDYDIVYKLSQNYKIVIYGSILDKTMKKKLSNTNNVTLKGKFKYSEIRQLCTTFDIGLLPYLIKKSHDGSPLKLYEYIKYNKPCITSIDYEIKNDDLIVNYNKQSVDVKLIEKLLNITGNPKISEQIKPEWLLKNNLHHIIMNNIQHTNKTQSVE
ncbi:hypothetical protein [Photobacterium sp.]|uniref:hypothetical protein n=1 Tax=Photobacterium sp. TaxID=660 RepID=UPI00299E42B9|nr:hypothetical protein [Photobacterium sp.]MDX1303675.1 hypothetical protein [Photobacterium sp.]